MTYPALTPSLPSPRWGIAALGLGLLLLLPAQAWAQDAGGQLAERIERAESRADVRTLSQQVAELTPPQKSSFVAWAAQYRQAQGPWQNLAEALLRIRTAEAAAELAAVAASTSESSDVALRALERFPANLRLPGLCMILTQGPRRSRGIALGQVEAALREDPLGTVGALREALQAPDVDPGLGPTLVDLVGGAYVGVEDVRALATELLDFAPLPSFAVGVARGIPLRLKRRQRAAAAQAAEQGQPTPDPRDDTEFDYHLETLERLLEREEPVVRVEVLRSLPSVLTQLNALWAEQLLAGMDHEDPTVRTAAWQSLQRVSGMRLQQSKAAWAAWWAQQAGRQAADDEDGADEPDGDSE